MNIKAAQAFFATVFLATAQVAISDHVLLEDGRVLYNVMVPEGTTAGSGLVRIRTGSMSFAYDPRTNVVSTLPSHSVIHRIADYVSTTTAVGRKRATALVQQRNWNRYVGAPVRRPLIAPTPAPKITPTPVWQAQATPVPLNVVPESVPLEARLDRQLDIFMKEQNSLVQDSTTSMAQGLVSPTYVSSAKVQLLQKQKSILERFYPQTTETVRLAVEYWAEQLERAQQTGRFDMENL